MLAYHPRLVSRKNRKTAAVALILRQHMQGAEVLFIERSRRTDDPWSGQMAFPGGKTEPDDNYSMETALRETHEEVGIRLSPNMSIGCLDDLVAPPSSPAHGLVVSCYAFVLEQNEHIRPNSEVHDTIWLSIDWMLNKRNFIGDFRPRDYEGSYPGIRVGREDNRVIWGLTFRFLQGFLGILQPDFSFRK